MYDQLSEIRRNFLRETLRFLTLQNYFLRTIGKARDGDADLASKYEDLNALVVPTYKDPFTYFVFYQFTQLTGAGNPQFR